MQPSDWSMKTLLFIIADAKFFCSHRLRIATTAASQGFRVVVLGPESPLADVIRERGIEYQESCFGRDNQGLLSEIKKLLSLIKAIFRVKPDVTHLVALKAIIYGGLACRIWGARAVVAVSGLGYLFTAETTKSNILRWVVLKLIRVAVGSRDNFFIFQNQDDLRVFKKAKIVSSEQTTIIPGSGTDLEEIRPAPLPEGPPVVVLPSRMLRDKGVEEFVAAAERITESGLEAKFLLVGDPDPKNPTSLTVKELQSISTRKWIAWSPFRQDIETVLANSHIVVLPSYREGFPKTLIDAAAAGRAAITTDVPGCREAVVPFKTGLVTRPRDVDDLVRALAWLIANREAQERMGRAAREHAEAFFGVESVCQRHMGLYSEAMQKPLKTRRACFNEWLRCKRKTAQTSGVTS
jgi:glycosyltransferase involved in cell wall biosynthesis